MYLHFRSFKFKDNTKKIEQYEISIIFRIKYVQIRKNHKTRSKYFYKLIVRIGKLINKIKILTFYITYTFICPKINLKIEKSYYTPI